MKIKEVIAKTDLTDRAIRLYIESGLVSPSITENYSGRKNIEFSHNDLITILMLMVSLNYLKVSFRMKYLNTQAKTKCNRTLLYCADTSEDDFSQYYKYLIFAYNEDKRLVRYIYSGAGGGNPGGVFSIPYYLTLDWYS